jgi:lactoylglutathione lyase
MITDMDVSLRFYTEGLGFTMTRSWTPEGTIRWCWLELGGATLMLQQFGAAPASTEKLGFGVSVCFQCVDALALYHSFRANGLEPRQPFVGNSMWVVLLTDPDGYKLDFESPTDAPEESLYTETP